MFCRLIGGQKVGAIAGSKTFQGYWVIGVHCRYVVAHRLAWLYVTGEWPKHEIDHIDGNRLNNKIANLRDVPSFMNKQNERSARTGNSSGYLGVYKIKGSEKWRAEISFGSRANRKRLQVGNFNSPREAHQAYLEMKRKLHAGNTL